MMASLSEVKGRGSFHMLTRNRLGSIAAWLLAVYLTQLFVRMGWGKFVSDSYWTAAFLAWGYPAWFRITIGIVEVTAGIGLLFPPVASYAALALAAVMMGAWSTLAHDLAWQGMATVALYGAMLGWIARVRWRFRMSFSQDIRPGRGRSSSAFVTLVYRPRRKDQ